MPRWRGEVVAVLLTHRGRLCLLRRSDAVASDRGRWHCVTGYLPPGTVPQRQAELELAEETGLSRAKLASFDAGPALRLPDPRGGQWLVHLFCGETTGTELTLNWENDDFVWCAPAAWRALPIVDWLPDVVSALAGCGRAGT